MQTPVVDVFVRPCVLMLWMRLAARRLWRAEEEVRHYRARGWSGYTLGMDSVRFGRALGFGARAAAKTLVTAVDAATSPNPSAKPVAGTGQQASGASQQASHGGPQASREAASSQSRVQVSAVRVGQQAARTTAQVQQTGRGLKQGGRRFGEAMWGPFVKLSGVLWLEVTGLFFGIFALFAGGGAWKMRGDLRDAGVNHQAHVQFLLTLAMAVVFGYFCMSSFVKASRRGRRG